MRIPATTLILFAAAAAAATLSAGTAPAAPRSTSRLSGEHQVRATRVHHAIRLALDPRGADLLGPARREPLLPVVVRFAASVTAARLAALEAEGVALTSSSPTASGAYLARVDTRGLDALEAAADVERVSPDWSAAAPTPPATLENVLPIVGAIDAAAAIRAQDGTELDGKGVVLGHYDYDVFVFHPALFRADAGAYAFTDVDRDGALTLDVDGVDMDGDGFIQPAEVLRRIGEGTLDATGKPGVSKQGAPNPSRDYVYLDTNGNGVRDYGKAFAETTPAYGEPIFVLDDVDGDGRLVATEKLLRLGTSKVRAIGGPEKTWVRGDRSEGLGQYPSRAVFEETPERAPAANHGTASVGLMVGGHTGSARRGIAQGAEVVLAHTGGWVASLQWLLDQGATVLSWADAPYTFVSMDGSDELARLMDAARARGVLTVVATGNLADKNKHVAVTLTPGPNRVPLSELGTFASATEVKASFFHTVPGRKLKVRVRADGIPWSEISRTEGITSLPGGVLAYAIENVTPRGTYELDFLVQSEGRAKPLPRNWELELEADPGPPIPAHGYLRDDTGIWTGSLLFTNASPETTVSGTATADSAIKVGAFASGDSETSSTPAGAVHGYSSRGPLLRGGDGVDVVAPTSSVAPALPFDDGTMGWQVFGGTSGSGPLVAGGLALLRQGLPDASADELVARLRAGAAKDDVVRRAGVTVAGQGKLDVRGSLGVPVPSGRPPVVRLVVEADGTRDVTVRVDASDDERVETLRVRWDLDYDGKPDTGWEPYAPEPRAFADAGAGERLVRVEVLDRQGHVTGATARLEVGTEPRRTSPEPASSDDGACAVRSGVRSPGTALASLGIAATVLLRRRRTRRDLDPDERHGRVRARADGIVEVTPSSTAPHRSRRPSRRVDPRA